MASSSSPTSTVSLYRYDLTQGMARTMGPMLIGRPLEGIWHTSVVVYGKEYYFDGGVGIMADPHPGHTRFGQPYRTEVLGQTTKRETEFFAWTQQQRTSGFGPNDYRIFDNNCNSFSDAASLFLLGRHIPQDIRDMIPALLATPMGQMIRPMLEQATSGGNGIGGATLSPPQPPPAPFSFAPASSVAAPRTTHGDSCAGLLSTRQAVTEADEEDLMLAQAMLESNETIADGPRSPPEAFEKAISGLTLLRTVMRNICDHPAEAKYRALSMDSSTYKSKLQPIEAYGVADVLRVAGFVRRPHSNGTGGEQWFLSDTAGSAAVLRRVIDMLTVTIQSIEAAAGDAAKARRPPQQQTPVSSAPSAVEESNTLAPPPPPSSPAEVQDRAGRVSGVLRYCSPPFPKDWIPLAVGRESGAPLFSIHCLASSNADGPFCFGKCRLSADARQHVQAHYCSGDGREVEIRGGYEVLCVRRGDDAKLSWVPAKLADPSFRFTGYGRFGVARAAHGSGVHPGVIEPTGRCVIPYGGRAVVVTDSAEVLCETARLPACVAEALRELQDGEDLLCLVQAASGQPISSFADLLTKWQPPAFYMAPQPLHRHTRLSAAALDWESDGAEASLGGSHSGSPTSPLTGGISAGDTQEHRHHHTVARRLLVCHDLGGGYTRADGRVFALGECTTAADCDARPKSATASRRPSRLPVVEGAYTVSYWDRTDCFVYFSHQRISVPPREWIQDAHRGGVPALGTIITEGADGAADLELLLTDAKRMASIIARLVQVCDTYGFDGYLLNVENSLPVHLAKRLVVFCTQLRKQLNRRTSLTSLRLVIWYDAITIDGTLAYQNALTQRNKPFFDVCDGVFTNYFWNPIHLAMSRAMAAARSSDVFVGVDVFGRNMYGGGGYNTYIAVEEAAQAGQSVALFAPGWTMEAESKGTREGFWRAECRLWSRLQEKFAYHTRLVTAGAPQCDVAPHEGSSLREWTAFQSGVGYDFYVNGQRVTGAPATGTRDAATTLRHVSGWCELSSAHSMPPLLVEAPSSGSAPVGATAEVKSTVPSFRLPATSLKGGMYGGTVRAEWCYDKAWFGNRCLFCMVPPKETAEVLRWYVQAALPPASTTSTAAGGEGTVAPVASTACFHVEVVFGQSFTVTEPAGSPGGGDAARGPVEAHRGLRLGLYSKTRGAFHAMLWERSLCCDDAATAPVSVDGVDDLQVRGSVAHLHGDTDAPASSVTGWCSVHYELHNHSAEVMHLTSVSVANGDTSRTLRCCVGAVGVRRGTPSHTPRAERPAGEDGEGGTRQQRTACGLQAAGPCEWPSFRTHATFKTAEQVLALSDADGILAGVRAQHGRHTTLVLFASVKVLSANAHEVANEEDRGKGTTERDAASCVQHSMYLGQYSVNPVDGAAHKGRLLIPVSLPKNVEVHKVAYYTVASTSCGPALQEKPEKGD